MRTRICFRLAAASAVLTLAACGGGGSTGPGGGGTTPPPPPPPPPVEVLTVKVSAPTSVMQGYDDLQKNDVYPEARIKLSVTASSNKGSVKVTCEVAGGKANETCDMAMLSAVGAHPIVVTGHSDATGAVSKDSVIVTVLSAKISCKFFVPSATGEYVPQGEYAVVGEPGALDSAKVGSDGDCTINTRYAASASARITFRGDPNVIQSSLVYTSGHFGNLVVIGVPRTFPILSGGHAGRVVKIDLVKATEPAPAPSASSFFSGDLGSDGAYRYTVGSWVSYPQCVAFLGVSDVGSSESITAADSVSAWKHLDSLEKVFGRDLVKPCSESQVKADGGISFRLQTKAQGNGGALVNGERGDYFSGIITLHDHLSFGLIFSIQHEFFHAFFGVGHTCKWDSIMTSSCLKGIPDQIFPEDVAYILLKFRLRDHERKYNTRYSLAPSVNGARLEQGLPEQKLVILDEKGVPIQ